MPEDSFPLCPLYVDLAAARVVIVGAGEVASRKVESMLAYGADVTVIALDACEGIAQLADEGRIAFDRRAYRAGDTRGARYVICATDDEDVNRAVYDEALGRGQLVNVVDVPELCTAVAPAVVRRGKLQIAISTGGASPSAARRVRQELEERYPQHWEAYLDILAGVRALVKERVAGPASVRTPLYEALSDGRLLRQVAEGRRPSPEEVYADLVEQLVEGGVQ